MPHEIQESIFEGIQDYILRPCMIHGPGNKGNLNLLYQLVQKGIPWPLGAFENKLKEFVKGCDAIVHLAAMNRHNDPEILYQTNIGLVNQLIVACEKTHSKPHILFSSSTQEERENLYGKSKKEGRQLLEDWARKNNAKFTGLVIPNVYGPFGNPYFNSVVATFCHQLTHNEQPKIEIDGEIKLIYVSELVNEIIAHIEFMQSEPLDNAIIDTVPILHTAQIKVSVLLQKLTEFKHFDANDADTYFEKV